MKPFDFMVFVLDPAREPNSSRNLTVCLRVRCTMTPDSKNSRLLDRHSPISRDRAAGLTPLPEKKFGRVVVVVESSRTCQNPGQKKTDMDQLTPGLCSLLNIHLAACLFKDGAQEQSAILYAAKPDGTPDTHAGANCSLTNLF